MNMLKKGFLLSALALLMSCATVYDVSYDYDKNINFSGQRTYNWLTISENKRVDQFTVDRIKRAVNANLSDKGLRQSSDNPDFIVDIIFGEKTRRARKSRYRYLVGYLSIDFIEPITERLIWHGTAKASLDHKYTPESSDKIIEKVVNEILTNYPPPKTL